MPGCCLLGAEVTSACTLRQAAAYTGSAQGGRVSLKGRIRLWRLTLEKGEVGEGAGKKAPGATSLSTV